jgi:hypothetical protein
MPTIPPVWACLMRMRMMPRSGRPRAARWDCRCSTSRGRWTKDRATPFPIAWSTIALTVGATLVASLLASVGPARRAAAIRPAIAVRVAD